MPDRAAPDLAPRRMHLALGVIGLAGVLAVAAVVGAAVEATSRSGSPPVAGAGPCPAVARAQLARRC